MEKSISEKTVEHIAVLGRLGLNEKEVEKFQKELAAILAYVEKLNAVATDNIEATSQVTGLENSFAKDEPQLGLSQAVALSQAPNAKDGFFKVKSVL